MSLQLRRAILESRDEVIGSFPVQWNTGDAPLPLPNLSGRLSADPAILLSLFDHLFTLTAEGIGTIAVRFIDDNGSFVLSSAHPLAHGEHALTAAAASGY